jgi:hypothetical protein
MYGVVAGEERRLSPLCRLREKDVRRFFLEHPTDIDLCKVDQLWFLDYVESDLDASYAQTHLSFF